MKIVRLMESGKETYGFVRGDKVATKDHVTYETGVPLPQPIKHFLFDGWFEEIKLRLDKISYGEDLSKYKILAPIPNPSKIICLAFNYEDHALEQNIQLPKDPAIVMKPRTTLTGTNSEVICPDFVTKLDYEIELALIVGRTIKNVDEKNAEDAIFGYMIFNDISARDIQFLDKQFTRGKSFDTFAPCGPWITSKDEISDPQNLRLVTKINGITRQDSSTSKMSIKIPAIVSKLSKIMTLERGDIISTGTVAGVALNNPNFGYLKDNDKIEMEIQGLGRLENTVRFVNSY